MAGSRRRGRHLPNSMKADAVANSRKEVLNWFAVCHEGDGTARVRFEHGVRWNSKIG